MTEFRIFGGLEECKVNTTNKELRRLQPAVESHSIDIFRITFVLFKRRNKGDKQENIPHQKLKLYHECGITANGAPLLQALPRSSISWRGNIDCPTSSHRRKLHEKKGDRQHRQIMCMDFLCFSMSYLLWTLLQTSIPQGKGPDTRSTKMWLRLLSPPHEASEWTVELNPQKAFSSPVIGKGL